MSLSLTDLLPFFENQNSCDLVITATGRSMIPTIVRGDRLHIRFRSRTDLHEVQIGDVVLCKDSIGRYLIHRVISVSPLRTKGDSLSEEDPPIDTLLGVIYRIEKTPRSRIRRWYLKLLEKK